MSTRRWIWIMLVCSLAITFGIWAYCSHREPTYEGRKLSSWLADYAAIAEHDIEPGDTHPAINAVRQIGTNALPTLINLTRSSEPPPWLLKILPIAKRVGLSQTLSDSSTRNFILAQIGFKILRTNAVPAIPDLVTLATNSNRGRVATQAIIGLYYTCRPGTIALASILKNPTPHRPFIICMLSAYMSSQGKHDADIIIPALMGRLSDSDPQVRREATNALLRIAPELLTNAVPQ